MYTIVHPMAGLRSLTMIAAAAGACVAGNAAIFITGDPSIDAPVTVQSTTELSFTITASGSVQYLVFDNWVSTPDTDNNVLSGSMLASFQINGGRAETRYAYGLNDNITFDAGSFTATDGYIVFYPGIAVEPGQVLTISPFTLTFNGEPGVHFNLPAGGTFAGPFFLADRSANPLSGLVTPVPEPAEEAALAGLGLVAFGLWRWRAARLH